MKFIRAPERYLDERGTTMWRVVQELLTEAQAEGAAA